MAIQVRRLATSAVSGVFLVFLLLGRFPQNGAANTVNTTTGPVSGKSAIVESRKVDSYQGIPYAVPPVGKLRFQPPQYPHPTWTTVLDATKQGPSCIQHLESQHIPGVTNEDCLFINVFSPQIIGNTSSLPVMLWIYGGGFRDGSSALYPGLTLAALANVVLVTFNYRVGALGFFSSPADSIPGNMGLLDQLAAMRWVKDNIAHFGGDPSRVTIFGESAGGASVALHLLSPKTQGYFVHAIAESGSSLCPWACQLPQHAREGMVAFAEQLRCTTVEGINMDCLRNASADTILSVQSAVYAEWETMNRNAPFIPVVDGDFLPLDPVTALQTGHFQSTVEVLTGVNHDEWSLFLKKHFESNPALNESAYNVSIQRYTERGFWGFPNVTSSPAITEAVKFAYTNWTDPESDEARLQQLIKAGTDFAFICPAQAEVDYWTASSGGAAAAPTLYMYQYSHADGFSPSWAGVPHAAEVPYVFGLPLVLPFEADSETKSLMDGRAQARLPIYTIADKDVSRNIISLWSAFAWNGNPSSGLPHNSKITQWPVYTPKTKQYLNIDTELTVSSHLHADKCALFARLAPYLLENCPGK